MQKHAGHFLTKRRVELMLISSAGIFYRGDQRLMIVNSHGSKTITLCFQRISVVANEHREFIATNNNELLKNVGNFVNRILKFCEAKLDSVIPEHDTSTIIPEFAEHIKETNKALAEYISNLKLIKLRAGLASILQ
jgi:hypothetical protein